MNLKRDKKKTKTSHKSPTLSTLRKGWMNIMRKKDLKFTRKEKKDNYGEILNVINKSNENVKRKKPTKA